MALLTKEARAKRLEILGYGAYTKANILKFQKKVFADEKQHDGVYGQKTDYALRHFYNVKKCAPSFKPEEFKCTCGRCTGYPSFMRQVELKHLQRIRNHYGRPMIVTSGLRCKYSNSQSSGSIEQSLHLVGRACDFYMAGVTDTLANRKAAIKYIKLLPNHHYTYGNGINSNGYAVSAPYMGNALHTDVNKAVKKVSPYYNKTVIIGQASCNEKGGLQGGKAGDQKNEVGMTNWYNGGWQYLFRAKNKAVRLKIAQAMIDTCNNQNIGYDTQKPDRYTAWDAAEKNGHNIKGINVKCETTCSQAVSMCLRAAGISKDYARRHYDIATMTKYLPKCPDFYVYGGKAYTQSASKLEAGDILLSSHHTIVVVKSPNNK